METIIINGKEYFYTLYRHGFTIEIDGIKEEFFEPEIPNKFLSYEENAKGIIHERLGLKYKSKDLIEQTKDVNETQLTIMEAMATQYEENLENQLIQLDVLATIYETQLEGAM